MRVRVAVDATGGDQAPAAVIEGALAALAADDELEVLLVGPETALRMAPAERRLEPVRSGPGVPEGGHPARWLREHDDAAVTETVRQVARGLAQAAVSVGHTGALMVAARWVLGPLPGVARPIPVGVLPVGSAPVLLDLGASTEARPRDLLAHALLGSAYAEVVKGVANPRVALISNGVEPGKGTPLLQEAYRLMAERLPTFVGYVEPVDMFAGRADVVVADGFVGNVVLKTMEGIAASLLPLVPEGSPLHDRVARMTDITAAGYPILLLGVGGVVVPGHGRAEAADVARAIAGAAAAVRGGLLDRLYARLGDLGAEDDGPTEGSKRG
jgi:glycerol-3-phosphate acyltransferase PlsX